MVLRYCNPQTIRTVILDLSQGKTVLRGEKVLESCVGGEALAIQTGMNPTIRQPCDWLREASHKACKVKSVTENIRSVVPRLFGKW